METPPAVITISYFNQIEISHFSKGLQDLILLIGLTNVYQISKQFGGQSKYVAKNYKRSFLIRIIPEIEAKKISDIYGGDTIAIPTSVQIERFSRNLYIRDLIGRGLSKSKIATKVNLSLRHIHNIEKQLSELSPPHTKIFHQPS